MPLPISIVRDNPWWRAVGSIEADPDLVRLHAAPVRFEHAVPFSWDVDAVYTLRGPRQVGKSTLVKRAWPLMAVECYAHGSNDTGILARGLLRFQRRISWLAWARG